MGDEEAALGVEVEVIEARGAGRAMTSLASGRVSIPSHLAHLQVEGVEATLGVELDCHRQAEAIGHSGDGPGIHIDPHHLVLVEDGTVEVSVRAKLHGIQEAQFRDEELRRILKMRVELIEAFSQKIRGRCGTGGPRGRR